MKLRSRMTGTALVLALSTVGLAACGSDDADSTDESSQVDETTDDAAASDDTGSDDASGDKPSKQEVIDGYTDLVSEIMGGQDLPEGIVEKVVTCFVDEVYDDASPQTLNAIATGDQTGINPEDASLFTDATSTCQQAALQ